MKPLFGYLLLAVMVGAPGQSSADQILSNPGFETGALLPWEVTPFSGPEDWNVTGAEAHSGNYSVTSVGISILSQDIPEIPTGQISEISFWLKQPEAALLQIVYYYTDGYVDSLAADPVSPEWEFFDVTAGLEPGRTLREFRINGYQGGGPGEDRSYLDDLTFEVEQARVPEPATLALAALGLSALGGYVRERRRKA